MRTDTDKQTDLELARTQFKGLFDDEAELRARLKSDHEYADGVYADGTTKRWDQESKRARGDRPMLHIDAMGPIIAQVVNGLAEARPAADMQPLGKGSDDEKAEVWEGLIRRIQTSPEAEHAGAYAAEHLTKLGRGYWVLTARYPDYNGDPNDPANWEMELVREWIENQHAVYLGPAQRPDGSDRMFGFILRPMTEDQFDAEFGDGEFKANQSAFKDVDLGTAQSCWKDGTRRITVASWYRIKTQDVTLTATGTDGQPATRTVKQRVCCLSTITATKEYAYSELPIPYIPIVAGEARRSNIDGQVDVKGMVRALRHPQDLMNLWPSYIQETIAIAARQEVIAAEGQITPQNQGFWDMTKRIPYRVYKPTAVDGTLVGPPTVHTYEAPIQAMTMALQQAEGFVRKSAGAFDADSDETGAALSKMSGRAMLQRDRKSELGNSDIARAYAFMILYEVKLIMAWAKHVYSAARILRITGRDEQTKVAVTHFGQPEDAIQMAQEAGGDKNAAVYIADLSVGRYDTKPRVIKNPLTQRQENIDMIRETLPGLPPPMQVKTFPILLEEMEGTVAKRIAAAFKPEQGTVSVEEAQQAQQMIDQLTQQLTELQQQMEAKAQESASRERIAAQDNATKLRIEELRFEHERALKAMELQAQQIQAERDRLQQAQMAHEGHEREIEAGDHAAAREFALREPQEPQATA